MSLYQRVLHNLERNPGLQRLYKNAGILFGGNVGSAALNLLSLAILTRALGVEVFGFFVLVTAYIALIDLLVSFQTWQALIHYGSKARQENAPARLAALFTFGWLLDIGSGVAGFLLACLGAAFLPGWFGLEQVEFFIVVMAASTLIFNWTATPTAILRLFDKFAAQALFLNLMALLRLVGFIILWAYDLGTLYNCILVWTAGGILARIFFIFQGLTEAKRKGCRPAGAINFKTLRRECPGLWRFVITTNIDGIVRVVRNYDIFIVNILLGVAATAYYKIAREIGRALSQLTGPFYQAIYPELARMAAEKDFTSFRKLTFHSSMTLGGIISAGWIVFALAGWIALPLVFGPEYARAYIPSLWVLGAMVIWAFAQPLAPALLALGKARTNLFVHAGTTVVYIVLLWDMGQRWGLEGAAAAMFIFYALWSASMFGFLLAQMKKIP
jgi:O-antigen/teichoic acid export membrane protein